MCIQLKALIFSNALRSVRVGGSVVYSTCTLSPVQNETVVENAVAIASERFGLKVRCLAVYLFIYLLFFYLQKSVLMNY